jgi:hypothetical protein
MEVFATILRTFWFLIVGVVLLNVRIMRPRVQRLVGMGRISQEEGERFLRGFGYGLSIPCVALGLIALWARWPTPLCAGIMSFQDLPSAASAVVILAAWAALLFWVWTGPGADLLGRVAPAMSNMPNWERTYSPRLVRLAITVMLLAAGVGGAVAYRSMPQDVGCSVPVAAA